MRKHTPQRERTRALHTFVQAIIAGGTIWRGPTLAPATAPESFGRSFGEGALKAPYMNRTTGAWRAGRPVRGGRIEHEGHRTTAELAALLWHAMGGAQEAPELAGDIVSPHDDPIIALVITRRRRAEYASADGHGRTCPIPGRGVWLMEIEQPKGDLPNAVAVWRSRNAEGGWESRCACLWTPATGADAEIMVIGARWSTNANQATGAACVLGALRTTRNHSEANRRHRKQAARRLRAIGPQILAKIAGPAIMAWRDRHNGTIPQRGAIKPSQDPGEQPTIRYAEAAERSTPPPWLKTAPARAAEALILRAAGEGWRIGASCDISQWRNGWAGHAELGAIAWHALADPDTPIDSESWRAMERAAAADTLECRSATPALHAASALVRKLLGQTGRRHAWPDPDERTLHAVEIPARLWRALSDAGPCPETLPGIDLTDRWWLVEIEGPGETEPDAVAWWLQDDGSERTLAAFVATDPKTRDPYVSIATWATSPGGERTDSGIAILGYPIRIDNRSDPQSQHGKHSVIAALSRPGTGPIARAKTAIALHLASNGAPAPLGLYRPSPQGERWTTSAPAAGTRGPTPLFALERAPEPERATPERGDNVASKGNGGGSPKARHTVRTHWKRQAHGPKHTKRRWQVIEPYERGPRAEDDQITITRLAEGTAEPT